MPPLFEATCTPTADLAAHIWEQGDTRTSREYDWVTTDGHYVTIPPGSSTDWHCTACPTVLTLETGQTPP